MKISIGSLNILRMGVLVNGFAKSKIGRFRANVIGERHFQFGSVSVVNIKCVLGVLRNFSHCERPTGAKQSLRPKRLLRSAKAFLAMTRRVSTHIVLTLMRLKS